MQFAFISFFLLIFSGLSVALGLPDATCLNILSDVGKKAEQELWPVLNEKVCSRGYKPGADDFPYVEKNLIIPLYRKWAEKGVKLPSYQTVVKPLVNSIVKDCVKQLNADFCNKSDLEKVKDCAVTKGMGFVMGHLDYAEKYGNEPNCQKFKAVLSDPSIWNWAKNAVRKFAKHVVKG
ncbi:hypothetical protein N7490_001810 [Penicillium lividum]|nr:hypothetical protein N7490_006814 [Penicillium lividum]KAJ5654807.1 hypothetical protein N7490_001810 [Penicillium lividum]